MVTKNDDNFSGTTMRISVNSSVGLRFKAHCKNLNMDMKEALEVVINFILDRNIHPDELEMIWDKKITAELKGAKNEVSKIHDYTASFLKTFEKMQENRDNNLNLIVKNLYQKQVFFNSVIEEILFNSQLFVQMENEELGKKISEKNWDNIIAKETRSKK